MPPLELAVVPRLRRVDLNDETVRFEGPFTVRTEDEAADSVAALASELLERETNERVVRSAEDPDVRLRIDDGPSSPVDDPEGYVLEAGDGGILVHAPTVDGLRHGCQTVVSGLERDAGAWRFPAGEVRDWPETRWRGFMLDPARGYLPLERVKRRIDQAARAKLNRLHLHLLDHESYALESEAFPELNRGPDGEERPAYSPDEIEELIAYAGRRGIDILPEIDTPGHATHVLETYPELRCTVADGDPSDRTLCLGTPETDEFVRTLLEEVIKLFPFETVHVGGDEWAMDYSWDECSRCRERMEREGSETVAEHFYGFVRRLHETLEARDRRLMCWNDQIDISASPDLPRDALVQFWRVAGKGRGPVEGCSLERFLEEGFEVVNSYVYAAYVNGWISEEYVLGWDPRSRPSVPDDWAEGVIGGELLAWEPEAEETREYFERALPSAIPVFADRLWNPNSITDRRSFATALTRHALGPFVPDGFDVYRELGGTILPTEGENVPSPPAHAHRSLGDRIPREARDDYDDALETLRSLSATGEAVYPETAAAYEECLEWLLEVADREARGVIDRP
ncbi:family 20 glycosylhydrolase [Natronococcus sp. JC468]|uniref:family 20 glycosylhydrolase n=1 Tax=Natronococcus sp. JC468 TaxID=1961921 RepID=UPI001439BE97|nr:family 20 glycosylhydrolase [Natronococcus sp. JC468]NKE36104.1 family 20 glycosylhydrolase [Natronococcus sp. JC468]